MNARGALLQHLHVNAGLAHQHHRAMYEGADRQETNDYTDHLQHDPASCSVLWLSAGC